MIKMLKQAKFSLVILALIFQLYFAYEYYGEYQSLFVLNPAIFSFLSLCLYALEKKSEIVGFLLSSFCIITSWRLSYLDDIYYANKILLLVFIIAVVQFFLLVRDDLKLAKQYEIHSAFVRIFLGYDLIPHFSEKLFAGPNIRSTDVLAFTHLGIENPYSTVFVAGLIEFAASIAFSCGFLTRLSSICIFIYLMLASYLGHHFDLGFIWANPGGGWEYPVLWSCITLSFAFMHPNTYSVDDLLLKNKNLPQWLRKAISF
jgi:putative oxidoreductase